MEEFDVKEAWGKFEDKEAWGSQFHIDEHIQESIEASSREMKTGDSNMNNVREWVRRSVLFWDKQDTLSIAESSDTEDVQESDYYEISNCEVSTETRGLINQTKPNAWQGLIDEVEMLQRQYIDPFFINEKNKDDTLERSSVVDDTEQDSSAYLTLNFPEDAIQIYSPLYTSNISHVAETFYVAEAFLPIENVMTTNYSTDDYLESQTKGQIYTIEEFSTKNQKEAARNPLNRISPLSIISQNHTKDISITKQNVVNSIKKVEETLLEISFELNNVRRKSKEQRDPNVILCNLLATIQPPVGIRDSIEELIAAQPGELDSTNTNSVCLKDHCMAGITKMASVSDVNAIIENDLAAQFEEELTRSDDETSNLPVCFAEAASSVRNLLRRISEEASPREILDFDDMPTELTGSNREVDDVLEMEGRRSSTFSYPSSEPVTPSRMNYDSGFGEQSKMSGASFSLPKYSLLSPDKHSIQMDSNNINSKPIPPRRRFTKPRDDCESETSTDWSPTSTLSAQDTYGRHKNGKRESKRCQSTGAVPTKPSRNHSPIAESCPNFAALHSHGSRTVLPGPYSRTEIEAIRKFLALTSHYFSSRVPVNENDEDLNSQLLEIEDIDTIRSTIRKQRDDLEEQRRQQEDLLQQLGDMLLQLVKLKEEHVNSRQRQAKALGYLKRQLDTQKTDLEEAHITLQEQLGKLEEKLETKIEEIPEKYVSEPTGLSVRSSICEEPLLNPLNKGHIIWKVSGIARKVAKVHAGQSEGIVVSESFYSGTYGYKMASWLYINGRGDFRGRGMSIYVCVLVGEYDAILHWPIKPNYKFTLVDQNPDSEVRKNHSKIRRVLDIGRKGENNIVARKGGIPRPQQSSKSLIAGFDDFISQDDLSRGHYIVDDTLFIKVEAEVENS